jgi:acyl carrier protein
VENLSPAAALRYHAPCSDTSGVARRRGRARCASARHPGCDPLSDELRLDESGLGFDSVALVELVVACERQFAVRLPAAVLRREAPTVGDLIVWLRDAGA